MGNYPLKLSVVLFLMGLVLLAGCEEEKAEVERLTERVALLESELSLAQRHSGEINQELGSLKGKNEELIDKSIRDRSELSSLRSRLSHADDQRRDAERQQESAAQFLQQRDELYGQLEELRDKVVETNALRRRVEAMEGEFDENIVGYDELVEKLNTEIIDLSNQVDGMHESVNAVESLQEELDSAKSLVKDLSVDHPQFFISLLQRHKELTDSDLLAWELISLELVSSRFMPGQVLRMVVPLEMADNRGITVLRFGSIEVAALGCDVDLVARTVTYTFPNAAEVRSVMEINMADILSVMFGPSESRSEIVFEAGAPVTGLTGTRIDFFVRDVKLSGLAIAKRSDEGIWHLAE